MSKRNKLEIIYDILNLIKEHRNQIRPTPLLRQSNLSSSRFKEYFAELIQKQFIKEIHSKNSKRIVLTNKGFQFLEKYKTIIHFIDEFEL